MFIFIHLSMHQNMKISSNGPITIGFFYDTFDSLAVIILGDLITKNKPVTASLINFATVLKKYSARLSRWATIFGPYTQISSF